ncbi:uncharacterized protein EV420DRAFT_977936 [Desarmillaria tabescens]|uniref:F-box domain-containing protein n=1 Tax=Armillaria tabescens TaxID=1929756 RepID=A0AA39JLI4_ARMTA|nr:uncharacterized protein EV420DRAFT_977936 [Desarmillaria tabescens]KAK0444967.1 hypothetical protein EV420DRAFT_977936 [Desarmillaria tabescens]
MLQSCTCRNCGFVSLLSPDCERQPQAPLKAFQNSNIVAQILRQSRTMLHPSEDASISADILELERLQSFYEAQLQEVQLHRRAVIDALEARRSIYAPIRRLPRDILIEIFHLVRHSWWQHINDGRRWSPVTPERQSSLRLDGPLWVLGRVCGLWRDTLHTSPASWAQNVVVRTPFPKHAREIWKTYLKRTGEHPLTVQVVGDIERSSSVEDDEILSLFVQESCHRWKDVIIDVTMHHMDCLEESISRLPMLQTIDIYVNHPDENYCSNICLKAPQLWRAMFSSLGISQVKLPPCITHYSGRITRPNDLQLLSHQSKLRVCHLQLRLRYVTPPLIPVPVIMPHIQRLFVEETGILDLVTLPRLESLVLAMSSRERFVERRDRTTISAWINHFLQRSGCHLQSLSMGQHILFVLGLSIHNLLASDAFSTLSFLKVELQIDADWADHVVQSLTPCSGAPAPLPNLFHLVLCIQPACFHSHPVQWHSIVNMIRARRDAGLLKIIEVQFVVWDNGFTDRNHRIEADIRALTSDSLTMLVEEWNPPDEEHWPVWGSLQ